MDDDDDITRLRRYKHFRKLTSEDKDKILTFCTLLAPEILEGKCIFQKDSMCHEHLVSAIRIVISKDVKYSESKQAFDFIHLFGINV